MKKKASRLRKETAALEVKEPDSPIDSARHHWRQSPEPVLEWWEVRWKLDPPLRWLRPAPYRVDALRPRHPIDELAWQAVHGFDERSYDEFLKNSVALRLGLLRWQALAGAVVSTEELEEAQAAMQLVSVLTTVLSAALDRLRVPRIDPTPLWLFENAAGDQIGRWMNGQDTEASSVRPLPVLLAEATPIFDRVKALGLGERAVGDVYVTSKHVALLLDLNPRTMEHRRKEWGKPDIPRRGSSPDMWAWSRLCPVIRTQYEDRPIPDIWPSDTPYERDVI